MEQKISRFFVKHNIDLDSVKYILSESPFTSFYFKSNREKVSISNINLKDIFAFLPEKKFLNIQKGIVVAVDQILDISDKGVYTMIDGTTFQGRQRYLKEHKKNREMLNLHIPTSDTKPSLPENFIEKCAILDNMPIAFCIIELVFDKDGRGMDFLFRYCNKEMEILEGLPLEEMIDHSFYEIFKNGDKKWLVTYADVALNGVTRKIHDYSPEVDKHLSIYCYQPLEGFCACALIPTE